MASTYVNWSDKLSFGCALRAHRIKSHDCFFSLLHCWPVTLVQRPFHLHSHRSAHLAAHITQEVPQESRHSTQLQGLPQQTNPYILENGKTEWNIILPPFHEKKRRIFFGLWIQIRILSPCFPWIFLWDHLPIRSQWKALQTVCFYNSFHFVWLK